MADKGVNKAKLGTVIDRAARLGLPVKMLRFVQANYNVVIKPGRGEDYTSRNKNTVYFTTATLAMAAPMNLSPGPDSMEGKGLQTIYHEAAHAYFDIKRDRKDREVVQLMNKATTYYKQGRLDTGSQVSNAERVAQEAAGEYIGHRIASFWNRSEERLIYMSSNKDNFWKQSGIKHNVVRPYNQQMQQRVFGYQKNGWWFQSESESTRARTTTGIPQFLKQYCDIVILENRIPERYDDLKMLQGH